MAPILFLLFCLAIQAPFFFSQGFYWDDWSQLFLRVKFGDSFSWAYFAADRPTSAWVNIMFYWMMDDNPFFWHLFITLLKWFASVLLYELLRKIQKTDRNANLMIVLFFIACPLFSQLHISVAYSQHFINSILFLISLLLTIQAIKSTSRQSKWLLGGFSIVFMVLQLSITEYFSLLELFRFPLIIIALNENEEKQNKNIKKALNVFLPYFLIFISYVIFRLNYSIIFPMQEADRPLLLTKFTQSPLIGIRDLIRHVVTDFVYIFLNFPGKLLSVDLERLFTPFRMLSFVLSAILSSIFYIAQTRFKRTQLSQQPVFRKNAVILSIIWILLAILPFWIIDNDILRNTDPPHADRAFLAALPGVCVLFYHLFLLFLTDLKRRAVVLSLVLFFFINQQFTNNNEARWQTVQQNKFYWQLITRIPAIESSTAFSDSKVVFPSQGNFATASALNLLYPNPITPNGEVPIWLFNIANIPYEAHSGYNTVKRIYKFTAPKDHTIFFDSENSFANCLWVLSPEDTAHPHLTDLQKTWASHSNLSRILIDEPFIEPDANFFGKQSDNWCMNYQRAALLRQFGRWDDLETLTDTVLLKYNPSDSQSNSPFEWWPFIESLFRSGKETEAANLFAAALAADPAYQKFLCDRLVRLLLEINSDFPFQPICQN